MQSPSELGLGRAKTVAWSLKSTRVSQLGYAIRSAPEARPARADVELPPCIMAEDADRRKRFRRLGYNDLRFDAGQPPWSNQSISPSQPPPRQRRLKRQFLGRSYFLSPRSDRHQQISAARARSSPRHLVSAFRRKQR